MKTQLIIAATFIWAAVCPAASLDMWTIHVLKHTQPEKVRITMGRNYYTSDGEKGIRFSVDGGNTISITYLHEGGYGVRMRVIRSRYITQNGVEGIEFVVENNEFNAKKFYLFEVPGMMTTRNGVKSEITGYNYLVVEGIAGDTNHLYASW